MIPPGFTISMSLAVSLTYRGTGARAPIFTNSWERGHQTPYQGFAPGPNWETYVSQITWPHTITEGPCPRQGVRPILCRVGR